MRYRILLLPAMFLLGSLGAASSSSVVAQTTPPAAPPPQQQPPPTSTQPQTPQPAVQPRRGGSINNPRSVFDAGREVDDAFARLRALEVRQAEAAPHLARVAEVTRNVYRKPNKKEMKALAPDAEHLERYAAFLREEDTGIVKLNADADCAGGGKMNVLVAKENCLPYSMPGGGTAYSFRAETYRFPHLADLVLVRDVLKIDGIMQQGIMVSLGDVPLETVSLETQGLKFLADYQPPTETEKLFDFEDRLLKGIKADGFTYGIGFYVKNQSTFALRSIAYRGKYMRALEGVAYNEMEFDKRKDILVAFRIVEQEEGTGNITLVWKILSRKDAPNWKFKIKKDETKKDETKKDGK